MNKSLKIPMWTIMYFHILFLTPTASKTCVCSHSKQMAKQSWSGHHLFYTRFLSTGRCEKVRCLCICIYTHTYRERASGEGGRGGRKKAWIYLIVFSLNENCFFSQPQAIPIHAYCKWEKKWHSTKKDAFLWQQSTSSVIHILCRNKNCSWTGTPIPQPWPQHNDWTKKSKSVMSFYPAHCFRSGSLFT